jgi:hypothetical protein
MEIHRYRIFKKPATTNLKMAVFWVDHHHPDDGGSKDL